MNRRSFLTSIGAFMIWASTRKVEAASTFLRDLSTRFSGISEKIYFPRDSVFQDLKRIFNPALTIEDPVAILRTDSSREIQNALAISRDEKIPVRLRSGGHSFEGFSMGQGLVVDVREFRNFAVTSTHVVAGAGLTLGELKVLLEKHNLSFPTGTCPSVGIAGYLLGGGHSVKSRLWGLGADRVQAMKVILANGERLLVSSSNYADLYWALLGGGGGNFALVEEFHLDLIPSGQDLIFKYTFPPEEAAPVFEFWERYAFSDVQSTTVQILISYQSGKVDFLQIFGIMNRVDQWGRDPQELFRESIWSELDRLQVLERGLTVVSSNKARVDGDTVRPFKGHSHYAERTLGPEGFRFIQNLAAQTLSDARVSMVFEPLGGAIQKPTRMNSYPHRHCLYNVEFYCGFRNLQHKDFYAAKLSAFHQGMAHLFSGRCYVNYPNMDLKEKALPSYFASSLPRLLEIKRKYDPDHLFNYGSQSLDPRKNH